MRLPLFFHFGILLLRSPVKIRKGSRVGIKVIPHKRSPAIAPSKANEGNRISIRIPILTMITSILITNRIYAHFPHRMISVMSMSKAWTERIPQALDLPPEALCDTAVGIIRGTNHFSLEHHKGILAYSDECIRIEVKRGTVVVHGRDLTIASMDRRCIRLKGTITAIELE